MTEENYTLEFDPVAFQIKVRHGHFFPLLSYGERCRQ
jgi:hypothetical protein